jgi:epsilon-lactone hydrolase
MANEVRVQASPVGSVVSPANRTGMVVLHLGPASESSLDAARRLALLTGATVVCARYRPRFPAAVDDAVRAYRYCRRGGPVVVTGERLGAALAGALLLRLRDSGAEQPRCAALLSAVLDLTLGARSLLLNARAEPALDVAGLRRSVAAYAGGTARTDPLLSPAYANLHGLPPIQLLVAGSDPLLDDSLAVAARAARSGVTVDLRVWPDAAARDAGAITAIAHFIAAWNPEVPTDLVAR